MKGATCKVVRYVKRVHISIRAPNERSDGNYWDTWDSGNISIRAPNERSDKTLCKNPFAEYISIRAPNERSDDFKFFSAFCTNYFNPRSQ